MFEFYMNLLRDTVGERIKYVSTNSGEKISVHLNAAKRLRKKKKKKLNSACEKIGGTSEALNCVKLVLSA